MSRVDEARDAVDVSKLLTGAAEAIASVRYCWLVTEGETGVTNARPMGRLPRHAEDDDWTIRFITDGRSRKVSDIWRADNVAVIFQNQADDAFVTLVGKASLRQGASELRRHWKDAYSVYFPGDADRANVRFVEVDVARMELWIRGVTPEPFGLQPTALERHAGRGWRLVPADRR